MHEYTLTYNALLDLHRKIITDSIDRKKIGVGIFTDLSKAFNTNNQDMILGKLELYGV